MVLPATGGDRVPLFGEGEVGQGEGAGGEGGGLAVDHDDEVAGAGGRADDAGGRGVEDVAIGGEVISISMGATSM